MITTLEQANYKLNQEYIDLKTKKMSNNFTKEFVSKYLDKKNPFENEVILMNLAKGILDSINGVHYNNSSIRYLR